MACQIQFFSEKIKKQHTRVRTHKHAMYELVYYISGKGYTTIDGKQFDYAPNHFTIIEPSAMHNELMLEDTSLMYFGFFNYNDLISLKTAMFQDHDRIIYRLIAQMADEIKQKQKHSTLKLNALLQCVLIEISRMSEKDGVASHKETFIHTIQYMQQYYSSEIHISQLAEMSGYSYDYFRHLFKEYVGVTPISYITSLRIDKAMELLLDNKTSIHEIALACGFPNTPRFSETFKKQTGMSPRQYRTYAEAKQSGTTLDIYKDDTRLIFERAGGR
ncbi:MAG: AraC family transcriptional regulator [Paenibacillus sp.]|jgi:AraC family transcriptional activator of pobA|nr:AraC family transcriptional regulator [Paenibacillus sp.]